MSETSGTGQQYWAIGTAVVGALIVLALLVQNVMQGREIGKLETDVAALQTSIVEARRAAGLSAIGSIASGPQAKARPKRGKSRSGAARKGKRGDQAAKPQVGGGRSAKMAKARPDLAEPVEEPPTP